MTAPRNPGSAVCDDTVLSSSVMAGGVCVTFTWSGKAFDLKAVVLRFDLGPFFAAALDLLAGLLLDLDALAARVVGRDSDSAARFRVPRCR